MDLVLEEVIGHGYESAKESTRKVFSVLDGLRIGRTQRKTAQGPRYSSNKV